MGQIRKQRPVIFCPMCAENTDVTVPGRKYFPLRYLKGETIQKEDGRYILREYYHCARCDVVFTAHHM